MDVSRFACALAAMSFVALLAGRSDGSTVALPVFQTSHIATPAISRNPAFNSLLLPRLPVGRSTRSRATEWASPDFFTHCKKQSPTAPNAYLFANEAVSATVYEYCEDIPPSPNTPLRSFGPGGSGLTISPVAIPAPGGLNELLAVGEYPAVGGNPGTISIYRVLGSGLTPLVPPASNLVLTNANALPVGLCFDGTGGLYATEYPTNQLDYWNYGQVVGGGGPPVTAALTITGGSNPAPFYGTYLACDFDQLSIPPGPPPAENIVMVDGADSSGGVYVGKFVAGPPPTVTVTFTGAPGGFPGGMTLNKHDYLVFNEPTLSGNVLFSLGPPDAWMLATTTCTYGTAGTTYYLPIVFDDTQREIWGGNSITAGSTVSTDAVSNYFPFGGACQPGESGGPTKVIPSLAQFVGIAVWRNTGE